MGIRGHFTARIARMVSVATDAKGASVPPTRVGARFPYLECNDPCLVTVLLSLVTKVSASSGVLVPRGGPPPILKPYRGQRLRSGASPGGTPGPACTRAAAGLGHALYSMVLVSGRPLRVDVRTCQNSSIFSILQCFTPVALVSHNSAQPDTSFVHFDP